MHNNLKKYAKKSCEKPKNCTFVKKKIGAMMAFPAFCKSGENMAELS